PTLSTTTMSGGRTTVDGDGSSDFLHDDGTIGAKFTGDQSFTRYWHVQIASVAVVQALGSIADSDSAAGARALIRTDPTLRSTRTNTANNTVNQDGGTITTEEAVIIESYDATAGEITRWYGNAGGLTKVADAQALDPGGTFASNLYNLLAHWGGAAATQFYSGGIRRHGARTVTCSDTDAAAIYSVS